MEIEIYEKGLILHREKADRKSIKRKKRKVVKRGVITSFSSSSRKRLRQLIVKYSSYDIQSITLTLPSTANSDYDYQYLWHRFTTRYTLTDSYIWRVELQKRGLPHWHLAYFGDFVHAYKLCDRWRDICKSSFIQDDKEWSHFVKYGSKVLPCVNTSNTLSYLVDHTSKRKESQLGWNGRQWGFIGRSRLEFSSPCERRINDRDFVLIIRQFRRLKQNLKKNRIYSSISPKVNFLTFPSCLYGKDFDRFNLIMNSYKKNKIF